MFSKDVMGYLKYKVERLLIRGPFYQVFFIACVIGVIALLSGQILLWIEKVPGGLPESSWWAFLRMSDPGYLGDDNGTAKRILSTVLTVLGYVLFMGSFVAIMTQWLYRKMQQLEAGLTPITLTGHICVLGYTSRTPLILNEILSSTGRLKRFLKKRNQKKTNIAILSPTIGYELRNDINSHLDDPSKSSRIILRTGSLMKVDDLERVNVEQCATVIIPAVAFGASGYERSDITAIKSLLSIRHLVDLNNVPAPSVVVEILDEKKIAIAEKAYGENIHIVAGHLFISRMIAQNTIHPGLSFVFADLLSQDDGNEIYLRKYEAFDGLAWGYIRKSFRGAIAIGVVNPKREKACVINPPAKFKIQKEDLIVFIAESFEGIERCRVKGAKPTNGLEVVTHPMQKEFPSKKVLILGWSQKVPRLVNELLSGGKGETSVDVMTVMSVEQRMNSMPAHLASGFRNSVHHIVGDYTVAEDLKKTDLRAYSNIIFLASNWLNDNVEADARSLMGYLQLRELVPESSDIPVLIELVDPENENLFVKKAGEIIISPIVISNILANVALRPELNRVLDELFYSQGPEISFIDPKKLGLAGAVRFQEIIDGAYQRGAIALGVMLDDSMTPKINPATDSVFTNIEREKIILIY